MFFRLDKFWTIFLFGFNLQIAWGIALPTFLISKNNLNDYLNGEVYFPSVRPSISIKGIHPTVKESMGSKDFLLFATKKLDLFPHGAWHTPSKSVTFITKNPNNNHNTIHYNHNQQQHSEIVVQSPSQQIIQHNNPPPREQAHYNYDQIYFPDNLPMESSINTVQYNRGPKALPNRGSAGSPYSSIINPRDRIIYPEEEESSEKIIQRRESFWLNSEPKIRNHPETHHFVARSHPHSQFNPNLKDFHHTNHLLSMSDSNSAEDKPYNNFREYRDFHDTTPPPSSMILEKIQARNIHGGSSSHHKRSYLSELDDNSLENPLNGISCAQLRSWIEKILSKSLLKRSLSHFEDSNSDEDLSLSSNSIQSSTSASTSSSSSEEYYNDEEITNKHEAEASDSNSNNNNLSSNLDQTKFQLSFQSLLNLAPKPRKCQEGQKKDPHGNCRTPISVKKKILLL